MADDGFKLPGASYDELCKIIKAYSAQPGETSTPQVAQLLGTNPTFISRNNGFLIEVGLLDEVKGRRKVLTDLGRELGRALEFEMADDLRRAWRSVVDGTEFLTRLVSAVRIRKGMEPSNLQSHVAYSAGQRKSSAAMTGARTVIAVLQEAGVLGYDDGKFVVIESPQANGGGEPSTLPAARAATESRFVDTWFEIKSPPLSRQRDQPRVVVSLELQMQLKPGDLDNLAPKIRQFMRDLEALPDDADEPKDAQLPDPQAQ